MNTKSPEAVKLSADLSLSISVFQDESFTVEELMFQCELLDKAKEYEGLLNCAICRVKKEDSMSLEEEVDQRDVFAVACKKYMTWKLDQWRVLVDRKNELATNSLGRRLDVIKEYLRRFNRSILDHLMLIIELLDNTLIARANSEENKIFFYKMLADYYRHMVDFIQTEDSNLDEYNQKVEESRMNYQYALSLADDAGLPASNPIYLALVLNYASFLYDMQNDVMGAISKAQGAFDQAIAKLGELGDDEHKEATLLLQLLRDNLQLWKHAARVDGLGGFDEDNGEGYEGLTTEEPTIEPER